MNNHREHVIAKIGLFVLLFTGGVQADDDNRAFTVHLADCSELIGFGPVSQAKIAPLVPADYTIVAFGPGPLESSCGLPAVSRLVWMARPPDPRSSRRSVCPSCHQTAPATLIITQLFYVTDDDAVADALGRAGVPALLDHEMAYEFTPDMTGHSGELYVAVSPPAGLL